jgi:hypothetical protein
MKQVYQTRDGETFEDPANARAHEDELFDIWLVRPEAQAGTVQDLLEVLDDFEETEFFDTPRKVFIDLLRRYFDVQECGT